MCCDFQHWAQNRKNTVIGFTFDFQVYAYFQNLSSGRSKIVKLCNNNANNINNCYKAVYLQKN